VRDTGGVKSLLRDNSESGAMSGLSAASKLSAAMQSVNPTTQLAPQSQHHVEEYHQQEQSADGTSSAMAAARSVVLHLCRAPLSS